MKIVPKMLNFEQKQRRKDIAQDMLPTFNYDSDWLKKVLTGDKAWVFGYDIEKKSAFIRKKAPRRAKTEKNM